MTGWPATMRGFHAILFAALFVAPPILARVGFGPGEQDWGFVTVREDAHMFWWLYYTTASVSSFYERPLLIWLQGGPGASSTSFGNFEELGPVDANLKPRNHTWVKDYNVLFIDNPVGTGFSYTSSSAYAKTNKQIAQDLLACVKGILEKLPEFADVPTYITTESYGGKMGADFALEWYKAQQEGSIRSNLKGVALGDAWISPIDSVMTWAPFLRATGMVDSNGYEKINKAAILTQKAVDAGQWKQATMAWSYAEAVISETTNNIDFYNILTRVEASSGRSSVAERIAAKPAFIREYAALSDEELETLMNGPVKKALQVPSNHGSQSNHVFTYLREDFMKPVIDTVELLLNETSLKVVVLTGQLDLIVDTPGTVRWVEGMQWKHASSWRQSSRKALVVRHTIEGYVKSYDNFAMYWVNRAGHMVPKDNPAAMAKILEDFTSG